MADRRRRRALAASLAAWGLALASALVFAGALPAAAQTAANPEADTASPAPPTPNAEASSQRFMVVVANPLAAEAGARALRDGGSAVDALIAAQLVLNVVEPQSSGIGGGAFLVLWDPETERLLTLDGRETAPAGSGPDLLLDAAGEPIPYREAIASGRSVGAPGLLLLLSDAHARYGRLPWPRLFEDAILLAEDGFAVSPRLAGSLERFADKLRPDPTAQSVFFYPPEHEWAGETLREGERLRQPLLAQTLRLLAAQGVDPFYRGPIAKAIVAAARDPRSPWDDYPGLLSLEDLSLYRLIERPAVCVLYRTRYEVCGMGPPSSGAVTVGQILGMLDAHPIQALPPETPWSAHLFLEASRLAYADRAVYLADIQYIPLPVSALLDPDYLLGRAFEIDPRAAGAGPAAAGAPPFDTERRDYAPDRGRTSPGTTHLSIVDGDGLVVSMTSTIESGFGSGRMAAGFLLNNQLTDFSFRPVAEDGGPIANAPDAGKRPRSSMAPTIVFDTASGRRRAMIVIGSPGGSRIIEYVALALVRMLDWGYGPAQAAAAPHLSHRGVGAAVETRSDADALVDMLEGFGHEAGRRAMTSGLHIIAITESGDMIGGADPRREGAAIGE